MDQIDNLQNQVNQNMNFLKTVVTGWKDGSLTPERVQILENGDMRILPPPPPDSPNGHKEEPLPLAEPVVAGKQEG